MRLIVRVSLVLLRVAEAIKYLSRTQLAVVADSPNGVGEAGHSARLST